MLDLSSFSSTAVPVTSRDGGLIGPSLIGAWMLILERHIDETFTLTIPGIAPVKIMVVDIRRDKVQIGIDAPAEVEISRPDMKHGKKVAHA